MNCSNYAATLWKFDSTDNLILDICSSLLVLKWTWSQELTLIGRKLHETTWNNSNWFKKVPVIVELTPYLVVFIWFNTHIAAFSVFKTNFIGGFWYGLQLFSRLKSRKKRSPAAVTLASRIWWIQWLWIVFLALNSVTKVALGNLRITHCYKTNFAIDAVSIIGPIEHIKKTCLRTF